MATVNEVIVKEEDLCCYICLEVYDKPRTLPCSHSFCHTCIVRYIEKVLVSDKTFTIPCPICRVNISLPVSRYVADDVENWVQNLPINLKLLSISSSKEENMSGTESKCIQCLKDKLHSPATIYCYDCSEQLCDKCKEIHKKVTMLANHNLIDIKNRQGDVAKFELLKSLTKCPEHHSEEVRFVCKDHNQLCCNECAIVMHRKCDNIVSINKELGKSGASDKGANERLGELEKYLDQLIEYELQHQSVITECRKEMTNRLRDVKKRIDNAFELMENSVCAQFDEKSNFILKKSRLQMEKIESLKADLKKSGDKMQITNDLGTQFHLFVIEKVLSNEIAQHKNEIQRLYNKMSKDFVKVSENKLCADIEANIASLISVTKKKSNVNVPVLTELKDKLFNNTIKSTSVKPMKTSKNKKAECQKAPQESLNDPKGNVIVPKDTVFRNNDKEHDEGKVNTNSDCEVCDEYFEDLDVFGRDLDSCTAVKPRFRHIRGGKWQDRYTWF